MTNFHTPVLLEEVMAYLKITPGEKYIDATVGGAGHAEAILKLGGKVLGIDHDPEAITLASKRLLAAYPPVASGDRPGQPSFALNVGNFSHLRAIAQKHQFQKVAGILFDLGVSTYQLTHPERGFSFAHEADLDMRMDPTLEVSAKDLVNALSLKELTKLLSTLTQERYARSIAHAILKKRQQAPITTTTELAGVVSRSYPSGQMHRHIHPATRTFLALRMAVNNERENLVRALPQAVELLKKSGRLVVLSFHETEDRLTKHFLREQDQLTILTKKPVTPKDQEKSRNPNARSAKLRAAEKH